MAANNVPTVLVIFGATGDLMTKKITPALFNLHQKGKLPTLFRVIGVGRRNLSCEEFHTHITKILKESDEWSDNKKEAEKFLNLFYYHRGRFEDPQDYHSLAVELGRVDGEWKVCSNKLFYLAVPPQFYEMIFKHLAGSGLTIPCGPDEGWTRVLVEKPFGKDEKTAERLDLLLAKLFKEEQIYRIDHYLAKEMLQNILSFRFSNNILEESWNNKFIEKIEIRLLEKVGAEGRGIFYDEVGALRDVGQNHLLQMLAFVTMEHPKSYSAEVIRVARAKILEQLVPPTKKDIAQSSFRAQYKGYRAIDGVPKNSQTETYFRIRGFLDAPRWRGVPVYFESGKRLKSPVKEIVITFKHVEPCLCPPGTGHYKNRVTFSLEPKEGIHITFLSKKPGLQMEVEPRMLEFTYRHKNQKTQYVEEYEKLLLDCVEGNQMLFLSTAEVKAMWHFIDPVIKWWKESVVPLSTYTPDTDEVLVEYL